MEMVARITEGRVLKSKEKLPLICVLVLVTILASGFAVADSVPWVSSYTAEQPASYQGDPVISEGVISFFAWERYVGKDLNGDGDMTDNILAYYDISTESVTYTTEEPYRLNGRSKAISGDVIAYIVYEQYIGQDCNGDGDRYDFILAYYNISTGLVTYTTQQPFWSYGNIFDISENVIVYIVYEWYASQDLNGDGDRYDFILAYYNISTGSVTYTSEQPYHLYGNSPTISEGMIAYIANEKKNARDLNGDGDMNDNVLSYYDTATGTATYTTAQPYVSGGNSIDISEGLISFIANESNVGSDLNNDGDTMDNILAYYDIATGSATYTAEQPFWSMANSPTISGGVIAFVAKEGYIDQDLNSDGDTMDDLLAYYDIAIGSATYTTEQPYWSKGNSPAISGNVITFIAKESDLDQDINGDADKYDNIIAYLTLPVDSDGSETPDDPEVPSDEDGGTFSITGLVSMIETLVEEGSIDKRMKNPLLSKIENAKSSVARGNVHVAVNQLKAMKKQVAAQQGKKLSGGAFEGIIAYTDNLIKAYLEQIP